VAQSSQFTSKSQKTDRDTAVRLLVSRIDDWTDQEKSSLITFPELAIFIGRPLLLVKVVSSDIPSALQTLAITSWDVYGSDSTFVPSLLVLPTAIPPLIVRSHPRTTQNPEFPAACIVGKHVMSSRRLAGPANLNRKADLKVPQKSRRFPDICRSEPTTGAPILSIPG
jgi:hypothetical protein